MKNVLFLMVCVIIGASCTGCMSSDKTGLDSIPAVETNGVDDAPSRALQAVENQAGYEGPYTFSGSGYANTPQFYLESGAATFELTMSGKNYNGAILYDKQYISIDGLVDQNYSGTISKTVEISTPGEYFIGMNSPESFWTATITQ
jgi:hypothetical protein